jgi:hypothetical protein
MRLLLRNSNAHWRRMFRRELLRRYSELRRELLQRYSELRREGNFPGSKLSGFCSGGIRNTQSTTCIRAFCCSHGQGCNTASILKIRQILLPVFYFPQSKIEYRRSKNCSAGNSPPFVNPGLKSTRTDAILK